MAANIEQIKPAFLFFYLIQELSDTLLTYFSLLEADIPFFPPG
jgi:hypothetical protein